MRSLKSLVAATLAATSVCSAYAWEKKTAPLMTRWADEVTAENVLPEYPRPQMVRAEWLNLNGVWEFDFTRGITNRIPSHEWKGCDRAIFDKIAFGEKLPKEILVPFPIESALSGVMERAEYLKYRRTFTVPKDWKGRRIRLNFDAVDWKCDVYVNGKLQGGHEGGYDAFSFDITKDLKDGENELIVTVYDPTDNGTQPVGKQRNEPEGYWYTSNSGIWQTVWLEPVSEYAATSLKLIPHLKEGWLGVTVYAPEKLQCVRLAASANGQVVARAGGLVNREIRLEIPDAHAWSPEDPFLYDLAIEVTNKGLTVDTVTSYFGMRDVGMKMIDGIMRPTINDTFIFQLGTLDQGYWPDGNLRAPTDAALKSDIENHKKLGFNLIRKHIKVEPQRWFYWCDKLGILVWQDMPSMHTHSVASRDSKLRRSFLANAAEKALFEGELKEMVDEHISSPSVVCWILFNEGWGIYENPEVKRLGDWLLAYDPSRWVNDSTGLPNGHVTGHVYDTHIYQGPSSSPYPETLVGGDIPAPTFQALGEFGGVGLNVKGHNWLGRDGWAYGKTSKDGDALTKRYLEIMDELYKTMFFPGLSASMYTQISDVEGETNGIYTYDRKVLKFDAKKMRAAHERIHAGAKLIASGAALDPALRHPLPKEAKRIRWCHGAVKFLVFRDEKHEVVGPDGKKTRIPELRMISDCNATQTFDQYWTLDKGLADSNGVSIRSMSRPNSYLAVTPEGNVDVVANDGSKAYAANATWLIRPGNEDKRFVSFESVARPGEFMRMKGRLVVTKPGIDGGFKHDSTFEVLDN